MFVLRRGDLWYNGVRACVCLCTTVCHFLALIDQCNHLGDIGVDGETL